jgi:ATP-dependent DNA helicase RecG
MPPNLASTRHKILRLRAKVYTQGLNLEGTKRLVPSSSMAAKPLWQRLGFKSAEDLLFYFPRRYLDFSTITTIRDLQVGSLVTVFATIQKIEAVFNPRTHRSQASAQVSDSTGILQVTWFNQSYLAKSLKPGQQIVLSGKVERYRQLQMANPSYELLKENLLHTGRIVPLYRLPMGTALRTFRKIIYSLLSKADALPDLIPQNIRSSHTLLPLAAALHQIHFPQSSKHLQAAQYRMAFEEALLQQLAVLQHKQELALHAAPNIPPDIDFVKAFLANLPFILTLGQKRALWEIIKDIEAKSPMNRLLQGDVGSGKTIVALIASLHVARAGFQSIVLAPTEILATQHTAVFLKFAKEYKISVGLLTHTFSTINNKPISREKLLEAIKNGEVQIVIGTHALLQEHIAFNKLAYVVIDEQHRFGVNQRGQFRSAVLSGTYTGTRGTTPHLLSMSATPIPRTLALTAFGDLEISTLPELPANRQTVHTQLVPENARPKAYERVMQELAADKQGYIVTPLVEESESLDRKSVKQEYERLQSTVFKKFRLGLLYGGMKGTEKEAVMKAFADRQLDILVSTSVIEIGIDVPNATVIIIEGAESFGLAQLHQLRGRVGRGEHKSYCFLFTEGQNPSTRERLSLFANTHNGFKLAEIDLQQRGFGSLFGTEQTGFAFKYPQYLTLRTLQTTKKAAKEIMETDPNLQNHPLLAREVQKYTSEIHLE